MSRRPRPHFKTPAAPSAARPVPPVPSDLGSAGAQSWSYLWRLDWLVEERHLHTVYRYCQLQDLLATAVAQVAADGFMVEGSTKQRRAHPAVAEIRQLATEARRTEIELGITPASASKAGVPVGVPAKSNADLLREAEEDSAADPRDALGLRVIEGGGAS